MSYGKECGNARNGNLSEAKSATAARTISVLATVATPLAIAIAAYAASFRNTAANRAAHLHTHNKCTFQQH